MILEYSTDKVLVSDKSSEMPSVDATFEHDERLIRLPSLRNRDGERFGADRAAYIVHSRFLFSR